MVIMLSGDCDKHLYEFQLVNISHANLVTRSSLVPDPTPSHKEKPTGKPSQISWASIRFWDSVT